jgi:Heavy metal associated domain 2
VVSSSERPTRVRPVCEESRPSSSRVVHALPGRVRVHVAALRRADPRTAEARLAAAAGVRRVRANANTGNILIEFDPGRVDEAGVVALAGAAVSRAVAPRRPSGGGVPHPDARGGTGAGRSPAATLGRLLTIAAIAAIAALELSDLPDAEHRDRRHAEDGRGRPAPRPSSSRLVLLAALKVASLLAGADGRRHRAVPADPWLSLVLALASVAVRRAAHSPRPIPRALAAGRASSAAPPPGVRKPGRAHAAALYS